MVNTNNSNSLHKRIESIPATAGRGLALTSTALWIISSGVVATDIANGRLVALPIDMRLTNGPIGIMTRAEEDLSPLAQVFRQAAIKAVEKLQLA